MKTLRLLPVAGLLLVVAGCAATSSKVTPVKADAQFTLAYLDPTQVDVPAQPVKVPSENGRLPQSRNGYATVQYIVDAAGWPREVQWVETSDPAFGRAAVALMEQARFKPAMKGGVAVAVKLETRVTSRAHDYETAGFRSGDERFDRTHYAEEASIYPHDINPFTGH